MLLPVVALSVCVGSAVVRWEAVARVLAWTLQHE